MNKGPAVLTSDVINSAQALFQMKATKKEGQEPLISFNDVLFILRGIGMNPTASDMDEVVKKMTAYDQEDKKDDKKKKKEDKNKAKKDEEEEKKAAAVLPDDLPKYNWLVFIEAVEQSYKNNRRCEEQILDSFKVFDRQYQKGKISLKNLITIMTKLGEDVLSPAEVDELRKLFGNPDDQTDSIDIDFLDFAKTMQEGQRPPPPPPPPGDVPPSESRKESQVAT
eukprot:TRINITY_DN1069_c8_g1_i1.p1 TRINITY_DN1069_c8_g1~~TRINITY_DN1069_c8_g1_i1.p1  ORF type:complete len:224 (+),score=61.93 TRINITY_DN1069_c8_g1_i1:42-713(+)